MEDAKDSVMTLHISAYEIIAGSIDGAVRTYDIRKGQLVTDTIGGTSTPSCVLYSSYSPTSARRISVPLWR